MIRTLKIGAGVVADYQLKSWLLFLIQLSANTLKKATKEGPCAWAPVSHTGNTDGIPGSWLWSGLVLITVAI